MLRAQPRQAHHENRPNPVLVQGVADLLAVLGNRYVAYYPALADLTGSPKAALMLGHAMFMNMGRFSALELGHTPRAE